MNKAKLFVKIGRKATGLKPDRRVTHIKHSLLIGECEVGRVYLMDSNQTIHIHRHETKKFRSQQKFTQKEVDLAETPLFFPEGFEKIFLAIYFVTLPYIAGLLFLFFYVAEGNIDLFLSLNEEQAFMLTWAIGYEIIAALILLWIVKMSISFANESRKPGVKKQFQRPT